jgi:hypothetical protein
MSDADADADGEDAADEPGASGTGGRPDDADTDAGREPVPGSEPEPIGLADARRRALDAAANVLEYEVDRVIRIEPADDGWRVLVEVVEREAVPDTNDILGRYELVMDAAGDLAEFGLLERYKRGELREEL